MANDLQPLETWLNNIAQSLSDNEKRQLSRRIASKLKQQMARRIRSQKDPSGAKFTPRKRDQRGRIRRGALFQRLPRLIKTAYNSSKAEVGFKGRTAKIMETHQYGLTAKPSRMQDPVRYPVRETLGFSDDDIDVIKKEIEKFMIGD